MAYNVGEAEVTVVPNAQRFNEELAAKLLPAAAETGRKMGDELADGIRERLALIGDVHIGVDTGMASAEIDKFLAETDAKAEVAGRVAGEKLGDNLSKSAAGSARHGSPLIMAAVAGGLIAGGPLLIGAAGVVFGGLAALILHNNDHVETATRQMATAVSDRYTQIAQVATPFLVKALNDVKAAALADAPAVGQIFQNLQPAIDGVTHGVLDLLHNALPGLVDAVRTGQPVFAGLQSLLGSIGTGLSNLFLAIDQHAPAMGAVLSGLGDVLNVLLGALGTLAGAGAELGALVLPPLVVVLQAVADVLNVMAPILPGIALAFAAFKVVGVITPLLASLAGALEAAGVGFGVAAAGARGLEAAMGPIGWILAGIGLVVPLVVGAFGRQDDSQKVVTASADAMTEALQRSKGALDDTVRAAAAMTAQKDGALAFASAWGVSSATIVNAALGQQSAIDAVTKGADQYAASLNNLAGTQDVSTASGEYQAETLRNQAKASQTAAAAIGAAGGATTKEARNQRELAAAISGSSDAAEINANRLNGLKTAVSAANTQITLLKTALDALTGKTISMDDAEVAVTQAVDNAKTALKGQTGALITGSGALNLHSQRGVAAYQALKTLAAGSNQLIATMEQQGKTTGEVAARDAQLRAQFIQTARQMGFSAAQANDLANKILGIPAARRTEISADTGQAVSNINTVLTALARLQNKTVTVTTVTQGFHVSGGGGPGGTQLANAMGNIVHPFASGGFESMRGGLAAIVPPNTLRVIGDRVKDDEAYIPINRDLRSIDIWRQTGERMGQLAPAVSGASGGSRGPASFTGNLYLDSGEFLGKVRGIAQEEAADTLMMAANRGSWNG